VFKIIISAFFLAPMLHCASIEDIRGQDGALLERRRGKSSADGKFLYHGLREQWHPNGVKKKEINYSDGKLDGMMLEWYPTGERLGESLFAKGKQNGVTLTYSNDGRLCIAEEFDSGVVTARRYLRDGSVVCEMKYKNGTPFDGTDIDPDFALGQGKGGLQLRAYRGGVRQGGTPIVLEEFAKIGAATVDSGGATAVNMEQLSADVSFSDITVGEAIEMLGVIIPAMKINAQGLTEESLAKPFSMIRKKATALDIISGLSSASGCKAKAVGFTVTFSSEQKSGQ